MREHMASMGFRTVDEMVGRADLLEPNKGAWAGGVGWGFRVGGGGVRCCGRGRFCSARGCPNHRSASTMTP